MEEQIERIKSWLGTGSVNIFGRPFAGKDTQGRKLADILGSELVAGGDILRSYHDQELIKKLMSTGDLFPMDLYLEIVVPYLSRPEIADRSLVLSAVGRLKGEEKVIMEATEKSGHPIKAVVLMNLSEDQVWQRLEAAKSLHDRGERQDDDAEALRNRLKKFTDQTMPVIEFYREQGLLLEVDGSLSRDAVTDEIVKVLAKRAAEE
ncbi:MAG: nucleoside monophosphate kinase [Candidatus Saccharimonadales bacterium]|nr:nucleoside monophosphate kinase [Candidatus Saccharimonadales bacterium]